MGQERVERGHVPTKLDLIIAELQQRPDLFLAGFIEKYRKPHRNVVGSATIFISPLIPTSEPKDLNRIYTGLRNFEPTYYHPSRVHKDNAHRNEVSYLWYGHIEFNDVLGIMKTQISRSFEIEQKEILDRLKAGFDDTTVRSTKSDIKRKLILSLFPHPLIAQRIKDWSESEEKTSDERLHQLSFRIKLPSLEGLISGKFQTIEEMLASEQ